MIATFDETSIPTKTDKNLVAICTPTITRPYAQYLAALEASVPAMDAAGIKHCANFMVGCPYISHARATMLRKALDAGADTIVFIDHDLSWRPQDLVKLIKTEGDVVSGLYRFKKDEEEYMGVLVGDRPQVRPSDGAVRADKVPAGFLKITRAAVRHFMRSFPELVYGDPEHPSVDLFNHGAHKGVWFGEDYSFSRRWKECGGEIWIVPDLCLSHHSADKDYPGQFHEFLLRQPGGSKSPEVLGVCVATASTGMKK